MTDTCVELADVVLYTQTLSVSEVYTSRTRIRDDMKPQISELRLSGSANRLLDLITLPQHRSIHRTLKFEQCRVHLRLR